MPKVRDPLSTNVDGQARLAELALNKSRGMIAPKKGAGKKAGKGKKK